MSTKVFDKLSVETLQRIIKIEHVHVPAKENIDDKKLLVGLLADETLDTAIKTITNSLNKMELKEACEPLNIDHAADGNNADSKSVLKKRVQEYMKRNGIEAYCKEMASEELVRAFVVAMGEEPEGKTKSDHIKQLSKLIASVGLQTFFNRFDVLFLKKILEEIEVPFDTDSKRALVEAIVTGKPAKYVATKEVKEIVVSKTKQEIKEGITYQDIYQHYLLSELQDWCDEHKLKVSGSKKEVINRILDFLAGNKENIMQGTKIKPKKKAMSEEAKKRKAALKRKEKLAQESGEKSKDKKKEVKKSTPEKKSSPSSPKKKVDSPKKKKPESDDEPDVEPTITKAESSDEEGEEEPDFEEMKVEELRKWCKDNGIDNKGTKDQIIKRIKSSRE